MFDDTTGRIRTNWKTVAGLGGAVLLAVLIGRLVSAEPAQSAVASGAAATAPVCPPRAPAPNREELQRLRAAARKSADSAASRHRPLDRLWSRSASPAIRGSSTPPGALCRRRRRSLSPGPRAPGVPAALTPTTSPTLRIPEHPGDRATVPSGRERSEFQGSDQPVAATPAPETPVPAAPEIGAGNRRAHR